MPFTKGVSGNPLGRPQGVKDRRAIFREMIEPCSNDLVTKAIELAMSGNEQMLRLLLDRLLPAKPKDDHVSVPGSISGTLGNQAKQILDLIYNGIITPTEGNNLLNALKSETEILTVDEFEQRLDELERVVGKKRC